MQSISDWPASLDLARAFTRFESADLELLDGFRRTVAKIRRSRFAAVEQALGSTPTVEIYRRATSDRRGHGVIRSRVANPDVREAVFPAVRKLRTTSNSSSISTVRKLLYGHTAAAARHDGPGSNAQHARDWLAAFKDGYGRALDGETVVISSVQDDAGRRDYGRRGALMDLAQNGECVPRRRG